MSKGILFIRSQNILSGSHDFSDAAFITPETHEEMSRSQVKRGDVFLNITGASIGRSAWLDLDIPANVNQHVAILRVGPELNHIFLSLFLNSAVGQRQISSCQAGASREALNYAQVRQLKIPLPPLEVQKEIVAEIEGYQKVINGARAVLDHYRPHIPIHPDWPMVPLSDVARAKNGFAFKSEEYVGEGLRVMRIKNVQKGQVIDDDPKFMASDRAKEFAAFKLRAGDILMSLTGNVGRVGRLEAEHEPAVLNQRVAHIELKVGRAVLPEFLFAILNADKFEDDAIKAATGVAQANLSSNWVNDYQIPLPPLATQQAIVAEIEAEQTLVAANRELLTRFEQKIQATLARIWGEEKAP